MKKTKNNYIYLIELLILLFIVFINFFVLKNFPTYINIINIIFFNSLAISLICIWGFPRDKNFFKRKCFKMILIVLLIYIIICYMLGLILGFNYTVFDHSLLGIIKNAAGVTLVIVPMEIIRYLIIKKSPNKIQIIILVIEFVIFNILIEVNSIQTFSLRQILVICVTSIIPTIAEEMLLTFMSYKVGLLPALTYKILKSCFIFLVPFVPTLGNYFTSVFGIILPFVIYFQIKKMLLYKEKYDIYAKGSFRKVIFTITSFLTLCLIVLISGLFKYKIIAIASGSMEPIYYRGDAVVFEKMNAKDIKKGDILVFKNNGVVITHRVMDIIKKGKDIFFKTKGDNNESYDTDYVSSNNVLGKVKFVVKYIGYPTVLLNDRLEGSS